MLEFLQWFLLSIAGFFVSALFYPFIEDYVQTVVVSKLNFLNISMGQNLSGFWTHIWYVQSNNFLPENVIKDIEIKQFGRKIFAQYDVIDVHGKCYTYQLIGKVEKHLVVTGTWKDIESGNRYHGCFQLCIDINERAMKGFWTGLSQGNIIKTGLWEWKRE